MQVRSFTMRNMTLRSIIGKLFWQPIRGSLILAAVLIFLDAIDSGSYLFSLLVCPIWFVVALILAMKGCASPGVAFARILIPVITGVIVLVNASVQNSIAQNNAVRIVAACEQYRAANGAYPAKLNDLVPQYMGSIPPAKYCLMWNSFFYHADSEQPTTMLFWVELPPFGRPTYNFEDGRWGYLD